MRASIILLLKVVSSLAVAWAAYVGLTELQAADHKPLAGALVSIAVTLLGFAFAIVSILAALGGQSLVENMKKTGHLEGLLSELFSMAAVYLLSLIAALCAFFLSKPDAAFVISASIALFCFATYSLIAAGKKLRMILLWKAPSADKEKLR